MIVPELQRRYGSELSYRYLVVLARSFSNLTPTPLTRAIAAYRRLVLLGRNPQKRPGRAPKRAKRLNCTEVGQLVERYSSGATVYELATEFGIHRTTISKHLKAAGVQMRVQPLTAQQVEAATTLYATGLAIVDVGHQLGVHASTVLLALRQQGVTMRNPWDHPRQRGCSRPGQQPLGMQP